MELARVSSKGQITIPIEIRKKLKLKEGDKVLFAEENGNIFVLNASLVALKEIQENMKDEAKKQYLNSEEDVNEYVEKIREEKWEQKYENND
jgi:AbrB family looped-hinge helix DNA binding protein